jgi:hypothetical protein
MTTGDPATDGPTRTVEVPERVAERIARRCVGTDFDGVDEYVAVALEQLLRELDRLDGGDRDQDRDGGSDAPGTEPPGERGTDGDLEARLESLGYL